MMTKNLADQQKRYEVELKTERDEVSRLREELKNLNLSHAAEIAEAKASFGEEKRRLEVEAKKHAGERVEAEKKALALQQELDSHRRDALDWLADLNKINSTLSSKCRYIHCTGICNPSDLLLFL